MVFLHREHTALANFQRFWAGQPDVTPDASAAWLASADRHDACAVRIAAALNEHLWNEELGHYVAYNIKTKEQVLNRTFLMAFPLYGGLCPADRLGRVVDNLQVTTHLFVIV